MKKCKSKECCCKCSYQERINRHPANLIGNGRISDLLGYACSGLKNCEKDGVLIFMDRVHGCCELFTRKKKTTKKEKRNDIAKAGCSCKR